MGKKPPLSAALSDPVDDEPDSAAVGGNSGTLDAAAAVDPASAVAAQSLETGLIMLLANDLSRKAERPPSNSFSSTRAKTTKLRRDYGDLKSYVIGIRVVVKVRIGTDPYVIP